MNVLIAGGSGQVGTILARAFHADRHEVIVLSRTPHAAPWRSLQWDAQTLGSWVSDLERADVVINLAGRSVNCRYNAANRRIIWESRVRSTQIIGRAMAQCARPPRVWLQASTATIYAYRVDAPNDETTGIIGGAELDVPDTWRFSVDVAKAWEEAAQAAVTPHTRLVLMRSAMIMSPDRGGIFDTLLALVRKGLGGISDDGRQFVSWIRDQDIIRAVRWLIDHEELAGPINIASPNPIPNADFMRSLRAAWGIKWGLPATRWMLEIGALLMRTETDLVLKSRRVIPRRLLESGYVFEFPMWNEAATDLCRRLRSPAHEGLSKA